MQITVQLKKLIIMLMQMTDNYAEVGIKEEEMAILILKGSIFSY